MFAVQPTRSQTYLIEDQQHQYAYLKWMGDLPDWLIENAYTVFNTSTGVFLKNQWNRSEADLRINARPCVPIKTYTNGIPHITGFENDEFIIMALSAKPISPSPAASWPFPTANTYVAAEPTRLGEFVVVSDDNRVKPATQSDNKSELQLESFEQAELRVNRDSPRVVTLEELDGPNGHQIPMEWPLSEPCVKCGGQQRVGDYTCWGYCYSCVEDSLRRG